MGINLQIPDLTELKPRITVFGVGGAGGNAVNNMIQAGLQGVEFVVANTDAQALTLSKAQRIVQMGVAVTEGLGAGSQPEVGRAAAEEVIDEINDHLTASHMVFITAGMGGGTGTGAAPVIARAARERGILTVGVVTKPFQFEGARRMRVADAGIQELQASVDTLIVIPNQNLFRIANERTTFADAFAMADQVLYSGVACITDLMVKEGLINLDFADVRSIMRGMGKAMMGTGEASGDRRAIQAAEAAIANPLLDEVSMKGARGLLISITGGKDLTLFEVDEAATRIREEVDEDANIILGATFDDDLEGVIRVSVVATGIDRDAMAAASAAADRIAEPARAQQVKTTAAIAAAQTVADIRPVTHSLRAVEPAPTPVHLIQQRVEMALERELELPSEHARHATHDPQVVVEPYHPPVLDDASLESEPAVAAVAEPAPRPYVPPQPERPAAPPRKSPAELLPGREARASEDEHDEERRPMSLLRRLATGNFLQREEQPDRSISPEVTVRQVAPAPKPAAPRTPAPASRPVAELTKPRPAQPRMPLDGGYRPAAGQLDPQGRATPPQRSEEDQLEIPAFLRRQQS